ncbi:MAG: N-acetylmuramoyl-L-alanine amidase, partial [candidate division WOR-3 bacterium]
ASAASAADYMTFAGQQLPVRHEAGVDYVPLYRLVQLLDGKFWRVQNRFVAIVQGDSGKPELEYVFWTDSALVLCAEQEILMPVEPMMDNGQLYLPVLGLSKVFPDAVEGLPRLVGIEVEGTGDTARVYLRTNTADSVAWIGETRSSLEYRLVLGVGCDTATAEQLALVSILAPNGIVQTAGVDIGAGTAIQLMFRRPALVQVLSKPGALVVRMWPRPDHKVERIVLDPGHGGKDPGAVGIGGSLEKQIVLDLSKRLKARLEEHGYEVLMTRTEDHYVPLSDRSEFANDKDAGLFISVHANASVNRNACGFETYFLSEAKTDWERTVAARENAPLKLEMSDTARLADELELILVDLAQNEFLTEASELAACIQEQAAPSARVMDRGVRQADFFVLRNNYMPAVLVEVGFISNRSEEKLLKEPAHREKLASGMTQGILDFIKAYERRVNGT